jgi:hypothetical protein
MIPILNNSGTSTSERILLREDAVRILFHVISKFPQQPPLSPMIFLHHVVLFLTILRYAQKFQKKRD